MLQLFLIFYYTLFLNISAPNNSLYTTQTNTSDSVPQPSMYIHFDKEMYDPGETIFFKAYLFAYLQPANNESDLAIKLSDDKGNIVAARRYAVINATAVGDINLEDSLAPGVYYFVAASSNTKDKQQVYTKTILIGYNTPTISSELTEPPVINVYPEGGNIFDDKPTVAVIKATDNNGFPKSIRGQIVTAAGAVQSEFETGKNGLARTLVKLSAKEKYAVMINVKGEKISYPLPDVKTEGLQLYTESSGDDKVVYLENRYGQPMDGLLLRCTMNKQVVIETPINIAAQASSKIKLQASTLPAGVMVISVYQHGKIITQRKLMIRKPEQNISSITVKNTRKKNNSGDVYLQVEGLQEGSYSISVKNADNGTGFLKEDINSRLLLLNNWNLEAYQQNLFLENRMDSLQLDNLLLASPFVDDKYTTRPVAVKEPYFWVTGTVHHEKTNELLNSGSIVFYIKPPDTTAASFYTVEVESDGKFKFDSLIFFGQNRVYYNYVDVSGKDKNATIRFDKFFSFDSTLFEIDQSQRSLGNATKSFYNYFTLKKQNAAKEPILAKAKGELDTVFIRSKKQRLRDQLNEKYMANSGFSMGGKIVRDNINDPYPNRSLSLLSFLLQSIQTIKLGANGFGQPTFVSTRNFSLGSGTPWVVDIYIDNGISDVNYAQMLRMDQVAFVKYYNGSSGGTGSSAPGGVIVVYLKSNSDYASNTPSWLSTKKYFDIHGYDQATPFEERGNATPSALSTFYWKPEIMTEDKKKIDFKFDVPAGVKRLMVEVEGFDAWGRLVSQSSIVTLE